MRRKLFPNFSDALDEAGREIASPKVCAHSGNNIVPKPLSRPGMYSLITEHHKTLSRRNNKEQDSIPLTRVVNAKPRKCAAGSLIHTAPEKRRDGYRNLAGGPALGLFDRVLKTFGIDG